MTTYKKPLPVPDPVTKPFWDGLKARQPRLQYSPDADKWVFYPRAVCPYTGSRNLEWRPISGRGVIHAFTIPHRHPNPAFWDDCPYTIVMVELDEGARLLGTLIDTPADPAHVKVGAPVELAYEDVTPEITLPRFRPRAG